MTDFEELKLKLGAQIVAGHVSNCNPNKAIRADSIGEFAIACVNVMIKEIAENSKNEQ